MKAKRDAVWRTESCCDRHKTRLGLREFTFLNACASGRDPREIAPPECACRQACSTGWRPTRAWIAKTLHLVLEFPLGPRYSASALYKHPGRCPPHPRCFRSLRSRLMPIGSNSENFFLHSFFYVHPVRRVQYQHSRTVRQTKSLRTPHKN